MTNSTPVVGMDGMGFGNMGGGRMGGGVLTKSTWNYLSAGVSYRLIVSWLLYFGIIPFISCFSGMDNFGGMNNMDRFNSSGMGRMNGKECLFTTPE